MKNEKENVASVNPLPAIMKRAANLLGNYFNIFPWQNHNDAGNLIYDNKSLQFWSINFDLNHLKHDRIIGQLIINELDAGFN